jgi:16S rRNA (adenine1518-N6/adenine1519-N6)-dimethyltransferase
MHPKVVLSQYGIEPKKSLGQNFLHDDAVLARIAGSANLAPDDQVLEIGPGLGALTHLLAASVSRVVAVELDQRLLPVLRTELAEHSNVTLVHGDVLELEPGRWFDLPYKVVANVPYYITGAILRHLLSAEMKPSLMLLTLQREVAERITETPPRMSLLAVSVQFYGQATILGTIGAGAFWPKPEVDSAILRIDIDERASEADPQAVDWFFRLAQAGFSQKRKQLKNNLRSLGKTESAIAAALSLAHIDGRRRAQTLGVEEWHALADALRSTG